MFPFIFLYNFFLSKEHKTVPGYTVDLCCQPKVRRTDTHGCKTTTFQKHRGNAVSAQEFFCDLGFKRKHETGSPRSTPSPPREAPVVWHGVCSILALHRIQKCKSPMGIVLQPVHRGHRALDDPNVQPCADMPWEGSVLKGAIDRLGLPSFRNHLISKRKTLDKSLLMGDRKTKRRREKVTLTHQAKLFKFASQENSV